MTIENNTIIAISDNSQTLIKALKNMDSKQRKQYIDENMSMTDILNTLKQIDGNIS